MPNTPLSQSAIKAIWTNQNPAVVLGLEANGTLAARLTEAQGTASAVQGDAISRGLSPEQARELAQDAVGLAVAE